MFYNSSIAFQDDLLHKIKILDQNTLIEQSFMDQVPSVPDDVLKDFRTS